MNHRPLGALTQLHHWDLQQKTDLVLPESGTSEAILVMRINGCISQKYVVGCLASCLLLALAPRHDSMDVFRTG